MAEVKETVELTELEQRIFTTLLEAARHAELSTTLRCAGGWVRDKLLGKSSSSPDIDIALDDLMGEEFATRVNEYLAAKGQDTAGVGVIKRNPDQSKHLETASMKVHGISLDLVNLRSETYAEGSRIPTMQFGTPEQDALRRDLTINSMFYNLNTGQVEDLTGQGRDDLRRGIIRTPLPPRETFLDDPLRVLRAVRFGARFGFELDAALVEAAASSEVRSAFEEKVSRERVGEEVNLMLTGPDPVMAVEMIQRLRLFPSVFAFRAPSEVLAALGPDFGAPCSATLAAADALLRAWQPKEPISGEDRRVALFAALLLPLRQCSTRASQSGKRAQPLTAHVVREALKWRADTVKTVAALHETAPQLLAAYYDLQVARGAQGAYDTAGEDLRVRLGRTVERLGPAWRAGLTLAPLLTMPEAAPLGVDAPAAEAGPSPRVSPDPLTTAADDEQQLVERRLACLGELEAAICAFHLEHAWKTKPLLDGKKVMGVLGIKGGPKLKELLEAMKDWQYAHPEATEAEAIEWLKQHHQQQTQ